MRTNRFLTTTGIQIALILFFAIPLSAQNYIVNSNADAAAVNLVTGETATPGQITLRSAVQAATAQPGAHIITFSGAVVSPINLTLGHIITGNAANGNNITIDGPGMNLLTVNQTTANRIFTTGTGAVTFLLQDIRLNYTGPTTPAAVYSGGGGAILAGGASAATTLLNVHISNFVQQLGNGGAISASSSLNNHSLTVTNCIFTGNRAGGAGGAISYNSQGGTATITGTTFDNNRTAFVGDPAMVGPFNTGGDGGAVSVTGGGAGGTYLIEKNTFLNNVAENPTSHAGAVMCTNGTATIRFNRLVGNTCLNTANPPLANILGQAGGASTHVTIANNNWWGVNTGPGPNDATALNAGAVMTLTKWLQLKTTASPNPICASSPSNLGHTSTVTTSFLSNSASEAIAVSNLAVLIGLPVTWTSTLGTLGAPQELTIQADGEAINTFTSNGTGGTATVNAQVDNIPASETAPARVNITVNTLSVAPTGTTGVTTVCSGGTTTLTVAGGIQGSGAVTQWFTGSCGGTLVFTGDAFTTPALIINTTYFVRYTGICNTTTCASVTVFVNDVTGGSVGSDQTICSGGDPAAFTQSVASTGTGTLTYQWQSSTTSCAAGFSDIAGATNTTYDVPSGVTVTTFYRRVTISTLNAVPCTANSNCITVTVNSVTGGTVAANQTICSGGDPAAFTQSVASTGSGALTYQWQSSTTSCAAGFSDIGGATATTYDPPAGLTVTTFYRRVTTSTLTAVPCTANSNCITVTVNDVTGGTVAADQTICSGGDPAAFTQSVASTGSGALTYQWQSSTTSCATGFSDIGGATATTYDPPAGLAVTTFYRRVTTSTLTAVPCTANSNCITVTVNDVTGGTVAADQTICSGGDPAAFTQSVASTGSGALTYQWQSSTTSCAAGFSDIGGATATTYDPPAGLAVTTYYRRVTTSTLNAVACTANSNCITVTVNSVTGGTVGSDHSVCPGGDPAAFTQSVGSTGGGVLTYQWQSSITGCAAGFSDIVGATAATYDAPVGLVVTTYYRRVTTSTLNAVACTANSNCITVTVNLTNTITLTSAPGTDNQTVLINTPITNITYATTGATGAIVTGLPTGVNGNWAANVVTISGTPTVAGSFNYTVTLTGGCGVVTASGTINVVVCSITLTSAAGTDAQSVCINTPITNITYSTTNATGANFSGLPAGVNGVWAADVVTISGTPTVAGTFNYTVTPTGGGCTGSVTATGSITVNPIPNVIATPSSQTVCSGVAITTIVLSSGVAGTTYTWTRDNTVAVTGIAASGSGNISGTLTNTTNAPVLVTFTITPTANGCPGPTTTATVLVNPTPNAVATPASQTICSGATITTIVLSGNVAGTTFNWTRNNTGTVTGIGTSGSGNISGALTNTTAAPITVTFTITPTANGCPGAAITATVLVNPTPVAVATPSSQTSCSGAAITTIVLSSTTPGTTYGWTRDNTGTVTGIAASGSGNISGSLTNTTNAPITVTFTITPTANGCPGAPITATVLVNPTPNAVATPSSQTTCSGQTITTIVLTGNVSGTVFNWTRNNTVTVTGIAASGSGNISGALTNLTASPITVTFTITPTANGCAGTPITATVLVNPTPDATPTPSSQTVCSGVPITTIVITGTVSGTTFNWVRDNVATVTGIAASGAGNISGTLTNTTNAPITVTFTITPTAAGCTPGAPVTATVLVNPTPVATVPANTTYCNGANVPTGTLNFTSNVAGTTFTWTNSNTAIGLGASGSGSSLPTFTATNGTNAPISGTITVTPSANGCAGAPQTFVITVNPTPNAVATPSSQTICSAAAITTIVLTGNVSGTTYAWTRDNTGTVTGIAASGSGNISGTLTNTTNAPVTVTFTITPTANGCPGTPITATVLVNPTPNAVATPSAQEICSGNPITTIVLSGNVSGTTYNWTRDNLVNVTGIAASGSGNISGTLTNNTTSPQTVTFTITPTANGCAGTPITATVVVNPTPTVNPVPNQTVCNGLPTAPVTFSGPVAGTTFNWTNNTPSIGLAASGSGNIASFNAINTGTTPVTATITVTPSTGGASGPATVAVTGFANNNANATILFNFRNNNAYPVTVTGIESICGSAGLKDVSAYYKTSAINGLPGVITAANGWNQFGAAVITGIANTTTTTTQPFMSGLTLVVPAGATYGICVQAVNQGTTTAAQRYSTIAAGTYTFSTAGCDIVTGTNIGYGGVAIPGAPTFTPRGFMGKVIFTAPGGGPVCTGPSTSFNITVNPTPNAVGTPSTQTVCSGTPMTTIVMSGNVSGTTYNWTRNNTINVTGIPNSGSGNISGTPINNTPGQQTVIFTITPTANGCTGTPITVTLIVNKAPTIVCPANITVNNTTGQCGAIVTYPPATVTGSPAPVVTYSQASGTFFPVGVTTVTATATNTCGTASCTFTVTVLDVQNPTITCPNSIVANTNPGVCTATITVPNPVTADNCAVTQLTWVMTGATTGASPATGINFVGTQTFNLNGTTGQGITTIVYTVRDAAGNSATCTFTVTVNDALLPVISQQPANRTVCVGASATFSVTASNVLAYQWQQWNGTAWVNIAGANASTFTVSSTTVNMNTNTFRVVLTGPCSVVISNTATLFVNPLPTVTISASPFTSLLPTQTTTISATTNPGGGTFVWFFNGAVIPGATGSTLGPLDIDDLGTYRVVYTDLNGCVATSNNLEITGAVSGALWVYPNPNRGVFNVRFYNQANEPATINVYDAIGQKVYQKAIVTGGTAYSLIEVNLGFKANGIYIVQVVNGSGKILGAVKINVQSF